MAPQNKFLIDAEKVYIPILGNEVPEAHLLRLFASKQGVNLFFNEGEPLSIILRKTIPLYKLVRRFQVFFDTTSINGQRHGASALWALAPKG